MCGFFFFFFIMTSIFRQFCQFSENMKRKQMRQKIGILGYTHVYHSKILAFWIKANPKPPHARKHSTQGAFLVWKRASANTWAPGVDSRLPEEKGWVLNPSMSMLQLQETSRRLSSGSPVHTAGFKVPTALETEILGETRGIMNKIPLNPQVLCKHCCLMRLSAKESGRVKTTWAEAVGVLASMLMTDPNTPAK